MNGLSVIGTAAAYLNLRKANAELEALTEQRDGILAAVRTYNREKHDYINEKEMAQIKVDEVDFPDGVLFSTVLRVGNLVGNLMRVQTTIVFTNTSDQDYKLHKVAADCTVLGFPIRVTRIGKEGIVEQERVADVVLKAGETIEIKLPCGISGMYNEKGESELGKLRDAICAVCNRKLITSCWKVNVEDIETTDILFTWSKAGEDKTFTCKAANRAGVVRYCMEAFYPSDK